MFSVLVAWSRCSPVETSMFHWVTPPAPVLVPLTEREVDQCRWSPTPFSSLRLRIQIMIVFKYCKILA